MQSYISLTALMNKYIQEKNKRRNKFLVSMQEINTWQKMNSQCIDWQWWDCPYQVRSPRQARSPSATVLVSGNVTILPAALDWAASLAPIGSAAKIRIAGLMDLAASATPDIKPPPTVEFFKNKKPKKKKKTSENLTLKYCQTNHLLELLYSWVEGLAPEAPMIWYPAHCTHKKKEKRNQTYHNVFKFTDFPAYNISACYIKKVPSRTRNTEYNTSQSPYKGFISIHTLIKAAAKAQWKLIFYYAIAE